MTDPTTDNDIAFMSRALDLARKGLGRVEPNPMVGCVVVRDGRVIGEGFHERFGKPHAEPNALSACSESPAGATVYVSLEPCSHANKKTPPCVPVLIQAKVARVVIGCVDPNPAVAGEGIAQLRSAGIEVTAGTLEAEAKQLNSAFFARVIHGRPYVTLKWAESADGKIAGPGGRRVQISGNESTREVHRLRAHSDAIVIGIRTLLNDDPLLTARGFPESRPPTRIVLDRDLQTQAWTNLVCSSRTNPSILCCSQRTYDENGRFWLGTLSEAGVSLLPLPQDENGRLSFRHLLEALGGLLMTHVLVEPGPTLAAGLISQNLCDRVWVFRSPDRIDDPTAPAAARVPYPVTARVNCGRDELSEYLNPSSPLFFAPKPSADFLLASDHCQSTS